MSNDWDYFVWELLADDEFRQDYEKCYAEDNDAFQIKIQELERKYGPIVSRNTIIEKRGDILSPNKTGHDVIICHQVNCLGIMGAGLAKQIREKFPLVYQMYKQHCDLVVDKKVLLGDVLALPVVYKGYEFTIANLFGQEDIGTGKCYTDYDALRKALQIVRCIATPLPARPLWRVRIPYMMGCGLAGGNWDVVRAIIQEELVDYGIIVEVWNNRKY